MRGILAVKAVTTLVVAGFVVLAPSMASASWSTAGSGNGYSKAGWMPTGATPTVSVTGRNVTVSWSQSTILGTPVSGYAIARFDAGTSALQTIGAACSGTISALTCTENATPAGSWKYAVTPRQGPWIGTQGAKSATATVAAASLSWTSSTTVTALPTTLNGNLTGYATGETMTFRLDNPSTGTVLAGSINPDPIPTNGNATFSVTIPAGTSVGAHTVYAVGSLGTQTSGGITVSDIVAPTVTAAAISKTSGDTPGVIKQGGTYYVYANVTDAAPSSGISTVTANVTNITTGTTAAPMTAGSYTAGGVSYNYRSALLTAANPLSAGSKTFTITATDASSNTATSGTFSVTVDNTAPTATDIQTTNKAGGTNGKPENGDKITYSFSEAMDPNSILAGWTGASTGVTVRLYDGGASTDSVTIYDSGNATLLPMGSINLGRTDFTSGGSGTYIRFTSTMVMSGSTITITLGTSSGSGIQTAGGTGTMAWTPSSTPTDQAGNACSTATATELGAADRDF